MVEWYTVDIGQIVPLLIYPPVRGSSPACLLPMTINLGDLSTGNGAVIANITILEAPKRMIHILKILLIFSSHMYTHGTKFCVSW
jgi:hypothetical protein